MQLNPNDASVNWTLGKLYESKKEIETAINYYKKAIELKPDSLLANFTLAFCYESKSKEPTKAHDIYERVLSLNPDPSEPQGKVILQLTYSGLGNSYYYDRKDFDKAIVYYKKSYDVQKTDSICEKIASAYKALKDYTNELKYRNEVIALNSSDSSNYNLRGNAYNHLGEKEKAILNFKKTIQLDPSLPYAYNNLANIYDDEKDTIPEAIKYYKLAYDRYTDETRKADIKKLIANLEAELAAPPSAEEIAEKCGLPTDRDKFDALLENFRWSVDTARQQFSYNDEARAYEILSSIKDTRLKLENFYSQYSKVKSKSDFGYYITLISLFEKLRFYFFDVALTPGLIQKVIANVFSSARIKKIFV